MKRSTLRLAAFPLVFLGSIALAQGVAQAKLSEQSATSAPSKADPGQRAIADQHGLDAAFTAEDRRPEAIAKAKALLAEVAAAYRAATTMTDAATISISFGEQRSTTLLQVDCGYGGESRMRSTDGTGTATVTLLKDALYIESSQFPRGTYIGVPLMKDGKGSPDVAKTLQAVSEDKAMLPPHISFRGSDNASRLDSIFLGSLVEAKLAGLRTNDLNDDEMLFIGSNGTGVAAIDAKSRLFKSAVAVFTPSGAPPEITVTLAIGYAPVIADTLASPIAFDKKGRKRATSIKEIMAGNASADGDTNVQVHFGDAPPSLVGFGWIGNTLTDQSFGDGNVYVVEFFAEWAPPSRKAIANLSKLAEGNRDIPLRLVHVGVFDHAPNGNRAFVENGQMHGTIPGFVAVERPVTGTGVSQGSHAAPWLERFDIQGVPFAVVVDREGRCVWTGHPDQLCDPTGVAFLRQLARQSTAPAALKDRLSGIQSELFDPDTRFAAIAAANKLAETELAASVGGLTSLAETLFRSNLNGAADDRSRAALSICDAAWKLSNQGDPFAGYLRAKIAARLGAEDIAARLDQFTKVFPTNSTYGHGAKLLEDARAEIQPALPREKTFEEQVLMVINDPNTSAQRRSLGLEALNRFHEYQAASDVMDAEYRLISKLRNSNVIRTADPWLAVRRDAALLAWESARDAFDATR